MNKVKDNKLVSMKIFFLDELTQVLGARTSKIYFERCCDSWLGMSKSDLILQKDVQLSESQLLQFLYGIKAFKKAKPLSQVLGEEYFYGLKLKVNNQVLIPRPETEELVDLIVKECKEAKHVLDVGTGSGCIAIALQKNLRQASVSALDVSSAAISIAKTNAKTHRAEVNFVLADIRQGFTHKEFQKEWDVIVSNPPYIPVFEKEQMEKNVVEYEPGLALFVPNDQPLCFYELISAYAFEKLKNKGKLYFEIHEEYGMQVKELLLTIGFDQVLITKDLQGKDRIVSARKSA